MIDSVFIYGSFSEGMVHFGMVANYIKSRTSAETKGSVYRLEVGFPVFILDGETSVPGTVIELNESEMLLKILDEYHGYSPQDPKRSLHLRQEIKAKLADGTEIVTNCYCLNPAKLPKSAKLLGDGDWPKALKEQPPMVGTLTERHICYIKKLSESSRRDTVVYPLDVCRELERMQIIVDKGRRFSLTNLGKEICRFV